LFLKGLEKRGEGTREERRERGKERREESRVI